MRSSVLGPYPNAASKRRRKVRSLSASSPASQAGLSHMEKLRPYFTLRDGSDRRGNSVVPHWIRFCSGFDSVAVCRQREGLPSIRANTTRAKPYTIALPTRGRGAEFAAHVRSTLAEGAGDLIAQRLEQILQRGTLVGLDEGLDRHAGNE